MWLGRRDGRVSIANETKQLPPPTANFTRLTQMFGAKGLSIKDLVVLSGSFLSPSPKVYLIYLFSFFRKLPMLISIALLYLYVN